MNEEYQAANAALMSHIERLYTEDDRAALAILRRSIGKPPGMSPEVFRIIGRFLPESPRAEEDCFLVAALFAKHPLSWPPAGDEARGARNFGASMHKLKLKREGRSEGVERRFSALLVAS